MLCKPPDSDRPVSSSRDEVVGCANRGIRPSCTGGNSLHQRVVADASGSCRGGNVRQLIRVVEGVPLCIIELSLLLLGLHYRHGSRGLQLGPYAQLTERLHGQQVGEILGDHDAGAT